MKSLRLVLCFALLTLSCGDFPRDPDGTLKRVQRQGSFEVGLIIAPDDGDARREAAAFLQAFGKSARARPRLVQGDAEPMLHRLKQGELDLVIGRFEKKSPWAQWVTIGPPLRKEKQSKAEFHLAPVMQNGENAWIALVEREVRNFAPAAR